MFPEAQFITTNGIQMAIYEQGTGEPVILLHGFPELAFSWRHQLPALAGAGYRAIVPDLRGYGASSKPQDVDQYTMQHLIDDVVGLLDAYEIEQATIVGHDWGAMVGWQMALLVPQRMKSLVALNIPFFPRPPVEPVAMMRAALGDDFYIVNFQDSDEADRLCDANPARVFEVMMRRKQVTREAFNMLPPEMQSFSLLRALARTELSGEKLLAPDEEQVYVDAYTAGGFTAPINRYRNWTHNWEATADVEQIVTVPALFIGAVDDVIISPEQIAAMQPFVPGLDIIMLEDCGHWSQQEKPDEINRILIDWLGR